MYINLSRNFDYKLYLHNVLHSLTKIWQYFAFMYFTFIQPFFCNWQYFTFTYFTFINNSALLLMTCTHKVIQNYLLKEHPLWGSRSVVAIISCEEKVWPYVLASSPDWSKEELLLWTNFRLSADLVNPVWIRSPLKLKIVVLISNMSFCQDQTRNSCCLSKFIQISFRSAC
jgi:hypothetical protein